MLHLLYKEKTKRWHDRRLIRPEFKVGDLVLVNNSRLKFFAGKLKSKWSGPFKVTRVFPQGPIEVQGPTNTFKVSVHRAKHHYHVEEPIEVSDVLYIEPS